MSKAEKKMEIDQDKIYSSPHEPRFIYDNKTGDININKKMGTFT